MMRARLRVVIAAGMLVTAPAGSANAESDYGSTLSLAEAVLFRTSLGFSNDPADVAALMAVHPSSEFGGPLTPEEEKDLADRLEDREDLNEAIAYLNDHPSRFGGSWVDYSTGDLDLHVVVAPSTTDGDLAAIEATLPSGMTLTVSKGQRTWAELLGTRDTISDAAASLGADLKWAYADPKQNTVVVAVGSLEDVQTLTGSTPGPVSFELQESLKPAACVSRQDCTNPWRGGTQIVSQASATGGSLACTWGFIGRPTGASSTRYVISAGHCNYSGGEFRHLGALVTTTVGQDRNTFEFGPGSVGSDSLRAPMRATTGALNTIMRTAAVPSHSITSIRTLSTTSVGDFICMAGISSSYRCGNVTQMGINGVATRVWDGQTRTIRDLVKTSIQAAGGDSGGPIFGGSRAWGIVSATDASHFMYFSPISNVMTDMGMRLCLNSACT